MAPASQKYLDSYRRCWSSSLFEQTGFQLAPKPAHQEAVVMSSIWQTVSYCVSVRCIILLSDWCLYSWLVDTSSLVYLNYWEVLVKRVNHSWNCCRKSSSVIPVLVVLRHQKCYPDCTKNLCLDFSSKTRCIFNYAAVAYILQNTLVL